jgi:hypothetical protein
VTTSSINIALYYWFSKDGYRQGVLKRIYFREAGGEGEGTHQNTFSPITCTAKTAVTTASPATVSAASPATANQ